MLHVYQFYEIKKKRLISVFREWGMYRYQLIPGVEPGHHVVLPTFKMRYGDMETVSGQTVSISG